MRIAVAVLAALAGTAAGATSASAAVEYVKVCDAFGAEFYYIPGTDTCYNPTNGQTRRSTDAGTVYGQSEMADQVSETEAGVAETQSEIDATNSELAKTDNKVDQNQKRIKDLQESQSNLEQRFDSAFDQSLDGIAIAMALAGPDLVADERIALKFNVGTYSGHTAFGLVIAAVLARTDYGRVSISGGVATTGDNTGGNVAVQLAW